MPTKDQFWDARQEYEEARREVTEAFIYGMRQAGMAEEDIAAIVEGGLARVDQLYADETGENN
jgi:hypothetical protein